MFPATLFFKFGFSRRTGSGTLAPLTGMHSLLKRVKAAKTRQSFRALGKAASVMKRRRIRKVHGGRFEDETAFILDS